MKSGTSFTVTTRSNLEVKGTVDPVVCIIKGQVE